MLTRIYNHIQPGGHAEFLEYAFEIVGSDNTAEAFNQASSFPKLHPECCRRRCYAWKRPALGPQAQELDG